jgi:DNA-binding response OmpR family regulator
VTKILLIDDDLDHLDITSYVLRREGFVVSTASDGATALRIIGERPPDLALLDVRMPTVDGFEVLRAIRLESVLPVIMLTAHGDDEDVVRGLQLGADDYVTKPFSPRQLVERVRAALRRHRGRVPEPSAEVEAAGLALDLTSHALTRGDRTTVQLTPVQFRILLPLMQHAGKVVPSLRLVEQAWGFDGGDPSMLKSHVSTIRKKLGRDPGEPGYIRAIPNVGYLFPT